MIKLLGHPQFPAAMEALGELSETDGHDCPFDAASVSDIVRYTWLAANAYTVYITSGYTLCAESPGLPDRLWIEGSKGKGYEWVED